ncbi:acyltransferase [Epilithonimonas zeae]|uniref:acyltransferase n=1 Tax=Epilithonimonas zeae TaxID=1416779 RepID=UPI00200E4D97|nr:acyltransferase [Epilithonimonas zeae]UQB67769.1 acyltransferase [Epilithonimonas zeae]
MGLFSKIIFKILKENSLNVIRKNKNSKIGDVFKIGNYSHFSIHPSASLLINNRVNLRNYCNFVLGENATVILEKNVFMNNYCSINAIEKIEIGENTLFGEGVKLYDHNHEYNEKTVEHRKFTSSPIKIGKNCWLGSNVTVLKGVTIGDNCIIGANCLVHKDVPEGTVLKLNQIFS